MIPASYIEWRDCIENKCGINLSPSFIKERLQAMAEASYGPNLQFINLYGPEHFRNIRTWLQQALKELHPIV